MSAKTPKRTPAPTMRERENLLLAALIDPNTRNTAAAVIEKRAVVPEMFTDETTRDNFAAVLKYGPDNFGQYLEQRPVADFTRTATAATVDAAAREIVAAYVRTHPQEPTPEEILAQAGMTIEDAADFLKRQIEPPRWIVNDFIALHMKGDLCGGSKSMKTFAALQMANCIAAGRDYLNVYHIEKPHVVAYLNLELFDWNAQERLNAQTTAAGLDIEAEDLRGRLYLFNMRANPAAIREQRVLGAFSSALLARGVELVIIDPRYKLIMPGEDENTGDGLRGVLALRDTLARHFAVCVVTHDPKGDTSERKTTDRGAGSYTAGADFDFRLTIDRARDFDETKGDLLYVVASACRARKTPPKVGVRFYADGQVFKAEDGISTELKTTKARSQLTEKEKAERNRKEADDFKAAALALANEHGSDNPIATEVFKVTIKDRPGGAVGEKKRDEYFNAMLADGVIVKQNELRRDPKTGAIVAKARKDRGRVFVMTPEAANAYRATFDGLAI